MPHEMEPEEIEPEPPDEQPATGEGQFVRRVSAAEQGRCCQGAIDVETLAYHCWTVTMVQGGAERRT